MSGAGAEEGPGPGQGASNGSAASGPREKKPFPRLSSFKLPRDLTLGAGGGTGGSTKPPPRKVFTPNLNVVRNKTKQAVPNLQNNKRENDKKRNDRNKSNRNGPSILKSSGVFSEGLGASERHITRSSYSRDTDTTPTLVRPTIRVKDVVKIDKELEEQKIKKLLGESHLEEGDDDEHDRDMKDAPVRLPITEGGTMYTKTKKKPLVVKEEIVIKKEPEDEPMMSSVYMPHKYHLPDIKMDAFDSTDIVSLLTSDKPKIMLLQLPDNLPGRGPEDGSHTKMKSGQTSEPEPKVVDNKCKLTDLEEGKIGKILVYKSGKVKLSLGETLFDISLGTQPCFRQDVMSVAVDAESRSGAMINLGPIETKLNVIPDWEAMFKDVVTL